MGSMKAAVLSLFLIGCILPAKGPSITLHADPSFTPPIRECIGLAADKWTTQTDGRADINVVYDGTDGDHIIPWYSTDTKVTSQDEGEKKLLGQVGVVDGDTEMRLVVDRLQDPKTCQLAAIHEFGHVFGIHHIETKLTNIMHPAVYRNRTACLKVDDLRAFCDIHGCITISPCPDQPDQEVRGQ